MIIADSNVGERREEYTEFIQLASDRCNFQYFLSSTYRCDSQILFSANGHSILGV